MLSWIRKFFVIRTRNLEGFIDVLRKNGCTLVRAYPRENTADVILTSTASAMGDFCHETRYIAETREGRKIVFLQRHFAVFGKSQDVLDARKKNIAILKALIATDKTVQTIKKEIPSISIEIIGKDNEVMTEKAQSLLRKEARRFDSIA